MVGVRHPCGMEVRGHLVRTSDFFFTMWTLGMELKLLGLVLELLPVQPYPGPLTYI